MEILQHYFECRDCLSARFGDEVDPVKFYSSIFPNNESSTERCTDFSKPTALYLYSTNADPDADGRYTLKRRKMYADLWEQDYVTYVEQNPFTLCSGLSYRQTRNTLENAQKINALIFDIDGVGLGELLTLIHRFGREPDGIRSLPTPTYLVLSGTGVHLYYVFDRPIDLYPNIKLQFKNLKYDLTFRMWEYKATSQEKEIQYQSLNQSFRMVGSINTKYDTPVVAYQLGERVTLDYLNSYVRDIKNKVDVNRPFTPSTMTKEQAKEAYPEWYKRVVIDGNKNKKKWDIYGKQGYALYEWWIKQAHNITGGHRYFFLMCMVIYACKCDVPKSKLKRDLNEVFKQLQNVQHINPLTDKADPLSENDLKSALEVYSKEFYNFKLADIEKLTNIHIKRNRRNFRKQSVHLKMARFVRDEINNNKEWQNKDGRPQGIIEQNPREKGGGRPQGSGTAKQTVHQWQKLHPNGTKADCNRDTKLDPKTIRKWWTSGDRC